MSPTNSGKHSPLNDTTIHGLNSLRLLAFLMVFLFHSFSWFSFGYTGVMFFYVISSFLLTYLALLEMDRTGRFSARNFFMRRAFRIYPLYFLILAFAFLLLPWLSKQFNVPVTLPSDKILYLLFLSNYDYTDHVFFLKLLWSIAVEEQFYLAFILMSVFFRKYFFTLCALLMLSYFVFVYFVTRGHIRYEYFNPLNYLPCFVGGMLLAKIYVHYPHKLQVFFGACAAIIPTILLLRLLSPYFQNCSNLPIAAIFCMAVTGLLLFREKAEIIAVQYLKVPEWLGKLTYGLYVYSGIVITLHLTVLHIKNAYLQFLVESVLLIIVAVISYKYYELPFLRLKEKWR